jgi:hypothetical protein
VVDHHVDRPEVEAGQPAQPTGTNRSKALPRAQRQGPQGPPLHSNGVGRVSPPANAGGRFQEPGSRSQQNGRRQTPSPRHTHTTRFRSDDGRQKTDDKLLCPLSSVLCPPNRPGGHSEGPRTRSHPELGRENPQPRWYCALRRGRVGRCQALANDGGQTTENQVLSSVICPPSSARRGVEQPGSSSGS